MRRALDRELLLRMATNRLMLGSPFVTRTQLAQFGWVLEFTEMRVPSHVPWRYA